MGFWVFTMIPMWGSICLGSWKQCAPSCQCSQYKRLLLQFFPHSLPFALFVFHLIMFCTHNLPCYEY